MKEGWTWLFNSRKEHYFRDGQSLCGKWMCLGSDFTNIPPHVEVACATCLKKREKEQSK